MAHKVQHVHNQATPFIAQKGDTLKVGHTHPSLGEVSIISWQEKTKLHEILEKTLACQHAYHLLARAASQKNDPVETYAYSLGEVHDTKLVGFLNEKLS